MMCGSRVLAVLITAPVKRHSSATHNATEKDSEEGTLGCLTASLRVYDQVNFHCQCTARVTLGVHYLTGHVHRTRNYAPFTTGSDNIEGRCILSTY